LWNLFELEIFYDPRNELSQNKLNASFVSPSKAMNKFEFSELEVRQGKIKEFRSQATNRKK
jgi:hypothetical protein